jgi:hypothetical protein
MVIKRAWAAAFDAVATTHSLTCGLRWNRRPEASDPHEIGSSI